MLKYIVLLLAISVGTVLSRTVTFSVIAFDKDVKVKVNDDKEYDMTREVDVDPLYKYKLLNAPTGKITYKYIVNGEEENFTRTLDGISTSTYYDFFGREETLKKLEKFQYPDNNWNRSIGATKLFNDTYIPTIHFSGENTELFFHNPGTSRKLERVTFYFKDSRTSFTKVPATAKNKNFEKFQIRLQLGTKGIKGRYLLKLRNGSEDPLNLRQTIYGNINQAIGIPSIHSIMVRVYYNEKPAGFYTLQEEAYSESFVKAEFYGESVDHTIDAPNPVGDTFDCSTGADFEYQPRNMSFYDPFALKIGDNKDKLIALTKALDELDTTDEEAVAYFDKYWFDIETFHKAMCMEYLTADWDGYWYFTSNFALYQDPRQSTDSTYKFYFITQDHDETFGVGLSETTNTVGYDFPKQSYKTMLNKVWHGDEYDAFHRTLVDKLIAGSPELQLRFERTLISIVKNIFNPVAFTKVVDSYYERYRPDVQWDYSFTRPYRRSSQNPDWRYKDFLAGFENPLPGLPWGLYEWVTLRAEAIKKEFCITWEGDANPPTDCIPFDYESTTIKEIESSTTVLEPTTSIPTEETTSTPAEETTILDETTSNDTVEEPTTKVDEESTTKDVEESTTTKAVEESTTTKAVEEPSTAKDDEEPTTKADEEPTTKVDEEPTTKDDEEPTTKDVEESTTTKAIEEPTTKADEEPTTKAADEPTTKDVEEPTTKDDEEPSTKVDEESTTTKAVEEPTTKVDEEPTTKDVEESTTTKAVEEPSMTKDDEEPTTKVDEESISTKAAEESTTKDVEEPTTKAAEEPSTTKDDEEPTTKVDEEPITKTIEEPTTKVDEKPTTKIVEESTAIKDDEEPTTKVDEEPTTKVEESTTTKAVEESTTTKAVEEPSMTKDDEEPTTKAAEESTTNEATTSQEDDDDEEPTDDISDDKGSEIKEDIVDKNSENLENVSSVDDAEEATTMSSDDENDDSIDLDKVDDKEIDGDDEDSLEESDDIKPFIKEDTKKPTAKTTKAGSSKRRCYVKTRL